MGLGAFRGADFLGRVAPAHPPPRVNGNLDVRRDFEGWPNEQAIFRPSSLHFVCITLGVIPEEQKAMRREWNRSSRSSMSVESFIFEGLGPGSGTVFLAPGSASAEGACFISLVKDQPDLGDGRQGTGPISFELLPRPRPQRFCAKLASGVRRRISVGDDYVESAGPNIGAANWRQIFTRRVCRTHGIRMNGFGVMQT